MNRLFERFEPKKYEIFLDLSKANERKFAGKVEIEGLAKVQDFIALHAKDLEILSLKVNEKDTEWSKSDDEIKIFTNDLMGENIRILVEFSGRITDAMHGLYPCYYKEDGEEKELFATQFESHHAREVFPCVDEPEAKAVFSLILKAEQNQAILSNTTEEDRLIDGDFCTVKFADTTKMSSYLLAFVVGDLQKKTATTKSGVEVSVWATKAQNAELLDFPLSVAVRVLDFYEEYFAKPFPLKKCDHVALPDFSSGAMENWGLITYRETALLAGEKSAISAKKYVALVVAHETSHQWFGNLVTMKWWDELWLNESFATMMEYFAVDNIEPSWNIWQEFAVNEAILSLRRDAIDGVQSVYVPVHHPDEINTIFDGAIVYAKGARLMNMLRNFVGDEAFRDGLRAYFKEFAYQNTTGEDLWRCLSAASGKNVGEFMNRWIKQAGYPVVDVEKNGGTLTLKQKQFFVGEGVETGKIWPIPLGTGDSQIPQTLDGESLQIPFNGEFVHLNQGNTAHFIANYDKNLLAGLISRVANFDTISRLQLLQERSLLVRGRLAPAVDLLRILANYQGENSSAVWDMMNILIGEIKIFVTEDSAAENKFKQFVENLAKKQFEKLGFEPKNGESQDETELRSSILGHMLYAENAAVVEKALAIFEQNRGDLAAIDAEIRGLILTAKVRFDESPELIDEFIRLYSETSNVDFRDDLMVALTSTQNEKTAVRLLETMKNPKIVRPQDLVGWFVNLLRNSRTRNRAWNWLRETWSWIHRTFGGDKSYDDFPRYAGAILRTKLHLTEFQWLFGEMKNEPSLSRAVEMAEREIASRIELIEANKAEVERFLLEN